jgi:hypothetical protein
MQPDSDQGALAIALAQLSYATSGVGTIKQKAIFKAKLPPRPIIVLTYAHRYLYR